MGLRYYTSVTVLPGTVLDASQLSGASASVPKKIIVDQPRNLALITPLQGGIIVGEILKNRL